MDWNKLAQSGLLGVLVTLIITLNNNYREFQNNLEENTKANQELLELHREWFKRGQN